MRDLTPRVARVGVPATVRLFVALWPGARVRRALAACRDRQRWAEGAAPTPTDKLHLTLHFIGDVPTARVAEVAAGIGVPLRGFDLQLDIAEHWRNGLAVLRPKAVPADLVQLHADLAAALRRLALPVENRAFRPHVTLARRVAAARPAPALDVVPWHVGGYALVRSTSDGRYELLRRYRSRQ